ncbi:MAG: hypothetical protein HGGPFJEG_02709 [Ignavibacteria bacterium]|nr:hypothetical protein [Ignavibacteria bacterium]
MKNIIKILCIYFITLVFLFSSCFSQDTCGTQDFPQGQAPYGNNFFGGYLKPHRTDRDNGNPLSDATLNMLFVFVQFADDSVQSAEWPIDNPPTYMNKFLIEERNGSGNFWGRYKDSSLSDYYQEISKGAFHVTGEARHLITNHNWSHYANMTY